MMALALASAAQLGLGLIGLRKALQEGIPYDVWKFKGDPKNIKRDQWVLGTGLSASGSMLLLQGAATVGLLSRKKRRVAAKILSILGAIMCSGYPAEKGIRKAWHRKSTDRVVTPLTAVATGLAAIMAVVGRQEVKRLPTAG